MEPSILGADTIAGRLRALAQTRPDDTWLVFEPEAGVLAQTTWAAAMDRASATAGLLAEHGVGPGGRFHVHLTNSPDFYDLFFAAALSGAVMVPTNPLLTADEIAFVAGHAACRLSITQPDLAPAVREAVDTDVLVTGDELAARLDDIRAAPDHDPSPRAPVCVLYTSGTTSRPKGVLVTHAAYLHAGHVVAQHVRLRPDDRQLVVLPLFHGNAQYYSTMSALVTGASVALAPRFSASRWSEQAETMGATVASLFAAPVRMLLAAAPSPSDDRHRLRITLFAQSVTPDELERFEDRFACPLAQLYGMTETVAPVTINPLYGGARNLTMGRPVLGTRVRVVDGELHVAGVPGVTLMAGYLDDPDATAKALSDGWLRTGDRVRADADGYLTFVDRAKDVVKRAGENISSTEVEAVVNGHPAVYESAVVGVPDPMYDEIVVAIVLLADGASATEEEVIAHCAERLAKFKVPSRVHFVTDLPRTPVGKIQKHLIRRSLAE